MNSQAVKKIKEISPAQRSIRLKIFCSVSRSPRPQYWAPRIEPAPITAKINMLSTKGIWVARDTAVISFWATLPSISASQAATRASIRLWKAMGSVSFFSFSLNSLLSISIVSLTRPRLRPLPPRPVPQKCFQISLFFQKIKIVKLKPTPMMIAIF